MLDDAEAEPPVPPSDVYAPDEPEEPDDAAEEATPAEEKLPAEAAALDVLGKDGLAIHKHQ